MKFVSLAPDNWRELRSYIPDKNGTIGIISKVIDIDLDDITIILGKNKDNIKVIWYFPINGRG